MKKKLGSSATSLQVVVLTMSVGFVPYQIHVWLLPQAVVLEFKTKMKQRMKRNSDSMVMVSRRSEDQRANLISLVLHR